MPCKRQTFNRPGTGLGAGKEDCCLSEPHKGAIVCLFYLVQQKHQNYQNRTGEMYKQLIRPLPQRSELLLALSSLVFPSLLAEKGKQQVSEIFFANGLKYYTHNYSLAGFFFPLAHFV